MRTERHITLAQLATATHGRWLGDAPAGADETWIPRVAIDSRKLHGGELFWTIRSSKRDGAQFVDEAFDRGALGVVTHAAPTQMPRGCWALLVEDGQSALGNLARWQRSRFTGQVAAVTGSVGKTTTRHLINSVLQVRLRGSTSPENYNTQIGLPLGMCHWQEDDDYAVVEMAARRSGEIAELCRWCRPHVGVVTRLGESHLESFGSRAAIIDAKAELLAALPTDGLAVLNADDPAQRHLASRTAARVVWVGRSAKADVLATHVMYSRGWLSFAVQGQRLGAPVWGRHHLTAALAAVAVGRAFGLDWDEIRAGLASFEPPTQRGAVTNVGRLRVIDDSYNASPLSMRAGLELLRHDEAPGRRIVACGDMCELGEEAPELHQKFGQQVVTHCGADLLVICGTHAQEVAAGAQRAGMSRARTIVCPTPAAVADAVAGHTRAGDVVLLKGSRAMNMEHCLKIWRDDESLVRPAA